MADADVSVVVDMIMFRVELYLRDFRKERKGKGAKEDAQREWKTSAEVAITRKERREANNTAGRSCCCIMVEISHIQSEQTVKNGTVGRVYMIVVRVDDIPHSFLNNDVMKETF